MKQKPDSNTKQGHSTNMLLYAVAPQPKLSTDAIALEGAVVSRGNGIGATSEVYLMDCIVGMKHYPDKYFDLAVVDPPYGIDNSRDRGGRIWKKKNIGDKQWDLSRPDFAYFEHLKRVSKNQIVWGGNYFADYLGPFKEFIFWDKNQTSPNFSDGELAWTSFNGVAKKYQRDYRLDNHVHKIHPTQKPLALYMWLLKKYANPGNKILDTHLGSGSSRIAAHNMGFDFTGFEIDEEYYYAQEMRFKEYQSQLNLFNK